MTTRSAPFHTTTGVARIFDKSESTIRLWVKLGKLRPLKLPNGQNLFEQDEIDRVLDELRAAEVPA